MADKCIQGAKTKDHAIDRLNALYWDTFPYMSDRRLRSITKIIEKNYV